MIKLRVIKVLFVDYCVSSNFICDFIVLPDLIHLVSLWNMYYTEKEIKAHGRVGGLVD